MSKKGGWFFAIFIFVCVVIFSIPILITASSSSTSEYGANCNIDESKLNDNVKALKPLIEVEMEKQELDVDEHLGYVLALLMQESKGVGNDPFQASESKCKVVGCIKTVEESIEQGLKVYKAKIKAIKDRELNYTIELHYQSYNYGVGYLEWLKQKSYSGYTEENAKEYSIKKCGLAGTSPETAVNEDKSACYGDYKYVEHIKQYLTCEESIVAFSGEFTCPYKKKSTMTQAYANPNSMYSNGYHLGVDLSSGTGTEILSISNGKVVKAVDNSNAGYGTYIMIQSKKDLFIIYGHMIEGSLKVNKGDNVKAGQVIGLEGSTGFSTGSHLHLETRKNIIEYQDLQYTYNPQSLFNFRKCYN